MMEKVIMVLVLFFSVIVHEVAHGYVALLNGDPTAKIAGRLTFSPIPHIDPIGTILLPALMLVTQSGFLFGWAKPVPVNPMNFRNYRWGEITVSAAGPLSNLTLAIISAQILPFAEGNPGLAIFCYYGCVINIFLMIFNLVPIPPLDGSRVLMPFLPRPLNYYYAQLEPYGFIIIMLLLYSGVLNFIIKPVYRLLMNLLLGGM